MPREFDAKEFEGFHSLSQALLDRRNDGQKFVLVLGAGCSLRSNCPSTDQLSSDIVKDFFPGMAGAAGMSLADCAQRLGQEAFNRYCAKKFADSKPSKGYWYLSELIKRRYFDLILTTNYDSCLEKTLANTMKYDDFRVLVRGDIQDAQILSLLQEPEPKIKIVKVHGDYQSRNMIVEPAKLWKFDNDKLTAYVKSTIERNGLIIAGSSLHDLNCVHLFNQDGDKRYWYVNPGDASLDHVTDTVISTLSIDRGNIISKEYGRFDEFFTYLSLITSQKEQTASPEASNDFEKRKKFFEKKLEKIAKMSKIEIDYRTVDDFLGKLLRHLNDKTGYLISNYVFIDDPDAPGGSELMKLAIKNHSSQIINKTIFKLKIVGRDRKLKNREATELHRVDPDTLKEEKVATTEKLAELVGDDNHFLLIDSVSFTGNTLIRCAERIKTLAGQHADIKSAVIYSPPKLGQRFPSNTLYSLKPINTYQILFPWGWTSSTEEITADSDADYDEFDQFIPHKKFSFYPRPWGNIFSMTENTASSVKILYLNPREKTSKHKHFVRDEIFFVLDEHMLFQIWDEHFLMRRGSTFRIPAGVEHRLIGLDIPCRVLEISQNYNDQVEDIERYEDEYQRVDLKGNK